jgi:glycosyltransferase involved in cell wall biosynthesis
MNDSSKISVCMATYNGSRFIRKQIDSILSQLSDNDELIISDDDSTDDTQQIIHSIGDKRIKLLMHKYLPPPPR